MRHLSVHLRGILVRVLNMMIFSSLGVLLILILPVALSGGVAKPVSGSVPPSIDPLGSLRPVSGVTQRLPLLNPLVNHHVALGFTLVLVKVLLLLVEGKACRGCSILLVAVMLVVLVL
jgi:hypothetical protein